MGCIGVLVLIHQDLAIHCLVLVSELRHGLQHLAGDAQQVAKIKDAKLFFPLFIQANDISGIKKEIHLNIIYFLHRVPAHVVKPCDLGIQPPLIVDTLFFYALGHKRALVCLIIDHKRPGVPDQVCLMPKEPGPERMECAGPDIDIIPADNHLQALFHLCGSLVGEGETEDL